MTYLGDEAAHLQPIELYKFTIGTTFHYFTDTERTTVHPITAVPYLPEPIKRAELRQSDEDSSATLEIEVDALNAVAEFFRTPFLPFRDVYILLERTHAGAVDVPAVVFRGQVTQATFTEGQCKLTCVPSRHVMSRQIPAPLFSSLCPNTLYDDRCQVDPNAFDVAATVTVVSGIVLTITGHGQPDGYFSGGTISQTGKPKATIREHVGNTFRLLYNYGFTPGACILLPGCDKKFTTCHTKFANTINFQGYPNMPQIDPFVDAVT